MAAFPKTESAAHFTCPACGEMASMLFAVQAKDGQLVVTDARTVVETHSRDCALAYPNEKK